MMTTVRQYESRDEQQLRVIAFQNYNEQIQEVESTDPDDPAAQAYLEHLIHMQAGGKGIILVAEQDQKLIGFVCLLGPSGPAAGKKSDDAYAFMSDLFVDPDYRNQGVGTQLIEMVEVQARTMGADNVALRVAVDNTGSRNFYTKNRYQEKFVVMSKELSF